jgi:hypothetical protein
MDLHVFSSFQEDNCRKVNFSLEALFSFVKFPKRKTELILGKNSLLAV